MNLMAKCIDKHKELLESFKFYLGCNWVRENGHAFPWVLTTVVLHVNMSPTEYLSFKKFFKNFYWNIVDLQCCVSV